LTVSAGDVSKTERIEVLHNTEIITKRYLQMFYNATSKWDYFADINRSFRNWIHYETASDAKGRGIKLRFVAEITKDNLYRCKYVD